MMKRTHLSNGLICTSRGPLVLLFYDGYELQAAYGLNGAAYSQARRLVRYIKRTVCKQQVRTGFYTAFLSLTQSLRQIGCDVRVNNFRLATQHPEYPIGLAGYPSIINRIHLPNPRIFGPGDFGIPPAATTLAADPRFRRLIQPSDWASDMYHPVCGDKMLTWFAGIDTKYWPDFSQEAKITISLCMIKSAGTAKSVYRPFYAASPNISMRPVGAIWFCDTGIIIILSSRVG